MIGRYGLLEPGNMANAVPRMVSCVSGALVSIAASADVFALRNGSESGKVLSLSQLRASFVTTSAFTAQALLLAFYKVGGFTVIHTTGSGLKTLPTFSKDSLADEPARALSGVECRIAGTAAMTGATYTAPSVDQPMAVLACQSSTTPTGELLWKPASDNFPLQLRGNEGVICRPLIVGIGSGGAARLYISAEFVHN